MSDAESETADHKSAAPLRPETEYLQLLQELYLLFVSPPSAPLDTHVAALFRVHLKDAAFAFVLPFLLSPAGMSVCV